MKKETRGGMQDVRSKIQEVKSRQQAAKGKPYPSTFVHPPALDEDAEDEAWVAQMMEWLTAPRADHSSDVIRRVIERVECLA